MTRTPTDQVADEAPMTAKQRADHEHRMAELKKDRHGDNLVAAGCILGLIVFGVIVGMIVWLQRENHAAGQLTDAEAVEACATIESETLREACISEAT